MSPTEDIGAFWEWWATARRRVLAAIEGEGDGPAPDRWRTLVDEVSERVGAIGPDLHWEFAPGTDRRHALCVSAGGNVEQRTLAERWRLAAPTDDDLFEFRSSRAPDRGAFEGLRSLEIGGTSIDPSKLRVVAFVDSGRGLVDIALFHGQLVDQPEDVQLTAYFLLLDWLLGEDGVERWVGQVSFLDNEPLAGDGQTDFEAGGEGHPADELDLPPGFDLDLIGTDLIETDLIETDRAGDDLDEPRRLVLMPLELASLVDDLGAREVEPTWLLLQGDAAGVPMLVAVRRPLKRVEFPLFDTLALVTLAYAERNERGYPTEPELERLRRREDELVATLGDAAVLAAYVTTDGVRTLFLYFDGESGVADRVEAWVESCGEGEAAVEVLDDPAWDAVAEYA